MKKSLLFIATMFLVNMTNAQNYHGQHGPNYGKYNSQINKRSYGHHGYHSANSYGCTMHSHGNNNSYHSNHHIRRFISDAELNSILFAIQNESFSSDKMNIARQATMFKTLRAYQVVEIGRQFNFESDRLEFAKMAFSNTFDKENYYLVNSIFHFSSSKSELNRFIYK